MSSSSDSYYIEVLTKISVYLYRYVTLLFAVVGNIGNFVSLLVFFKKSWRKNVCVFYFKMYLLFSICYINSTMLGTILTAGFNISLQNSSVLLCKLIYYVSFVTATLPPTVLLLASIDRLLISSQNVDTRLYSSKRLAYFSISISSFFWIVFNFHVLIKVNIQEIYPSYFLCYYDPSSLYRNFVSYSVAVINVVFSVLMIVLCIFAFKNVRRIRAIPRQQRQQIRSMTKKDFQLLRCLFVQDIVFITFCNPLSIFYVYSAITNDYLRTPLEEVVINFVNCLVTTLYSIVYCDNFFIFVIVSKAFRHELKRLVYAMFGKNLVPLREEDNKQQNIDRNNIELNVVANNIVSTA